MSKPTSTHQEATFHILKYVKDSPAQGLFLPSNSCLKLKVVSDSDWASCPDSRRFITSYRVFLGGSLVSWKSKKQDFKVPFTSPYLLCCNSQSARHIASNSSFRERTKHVELDCCIVHEKLQSNLLHLLPITSSAQFADVITKALFLTQFKTLVAKLGVLFIHPPA